MTKKIIVRCSQRHKCPSNFVARVWEKCLQAKSRVNKKWFSQFDVEEMTCTEH